MSDGQETPFQPCDGICPLDSEVRAALERLTGHPLFVKAPRLSEFLTYIVKKSLAGHGDKISGYAIGVDVYGKPETFDAVVDTIVRVEAGRLRRTLADYYREAGVDDPVEIVVPKGTYAPEFRYRTGNRVITAVVSSTEPQQSTRPDRGPSIAVLPFENYSGNANDQFFADGLTEETIANLARFKDLFVFSRSTTSKLSRERVDIRQFHEELGVDFVVEGSVRKSSNAVRVTAQLIDAKTDAHLFAERFNRPCTPEGVFEIQDEIALLVAGRVADRHGPLGRYVSRAGRVGQSKRWETYFWITKFYDYYASHHPARHLEVREGLAEALNHDEESSDGWAALSFILLDEYRLHINERASYPALDHAVSHAQRAVSCDPDNAFAYHALAMAYFHSSEATDFRIAASRALNLNPGLADVLADLSVCYVLLGEWDESLRLINRAIELSPMHPGWYRHSRAVNYLAKGDVEAALMELKQVPMPGFFWHHALRAGLSAELGNNEEAANEVDQLLIAYPNFADNVHREIEIWNMHDSVAKKLISGWRKAGLKIA